MRTVTTKLISHVFIVLPGKLKPKNTNDVLITGNILQYYLQNRTEKQEARMEGGGRFQLFQEPKPGDLTKTSDLIFFSELRLYYSRIPVTRTPPLTPT